MNNNVAAAAVAGAILFGATSAQACGDKFVLMGRGSLVARAKYPSTILIFMNPGSRVAAAEQEFHLDAVLKAAGHKPVILESESEVKKAVASGKYDLVLADVVDTPNLRKEAGATPGKPVVLPLLYKPTPAELSAAEKDANCMVRASNKSRDLLVVIDEAMQSRRKGIAAVCETAK